MDSSETSIDNVPSELITCLYRIIGIQASLKTLPSNSKLHRAWQSAVEKVTLNYTLLHAVDVSILAKLVNLTELKFKGSPDDSRQASHPVWHVIACLGLQLTRLKSISLVDVPEGFQVLRSIAGMEGLVRRLEALEISDRRHIIASDDLWALRSLTALKTLRLASECVLPSERAPQDLGKQLSLLQDLELTTKPQRDCHFDILPGSLTSLTALKVSMLVGFATMDVDEQELRLISAASRLTGLRRLCTDVALASEEGQREALAALKQLTYLELQQGAMTVINAGFIMLPELPELVTLVVPDHAAHDFLTHPSLQHLEAGSVDVSEESRGKTAEACKLQRLVLDPLLDGTAHDDDLEHLPLLPDLRSVDLYVFSDDQPFRSVAAMLRRQATGLERVSLMVSGDGDFEEALPREMPVCRELELGSCSRHTLQLLAMCSMPQLERLRLCGVAGIEHAADLAWLRSFPCLRKVRLITASRFPVSDAVRAQVVQMMEGSGVELEWRC